MSRRPVKTVKIRVRVLHRRDQNNHKKPLPALSGVNNIFYNLNISWIFKSAIRILFFLSRQKIHVVFALPVPTQKTFFSRPFHDLWRPWKDRFKILTIFGIFLKKLKGIFSSATSAVFPVPSAMLDEIDLLLFVVIGQSCHWQVRDFPAKIWISRCSTKRLGSFSRVLTFSLNFFILSRQKWEMNHQYRLLMEQGF